MIFIVIKGKATGDAPELNMYLFRTTKPSVQSGSLLCRRRVILAENSVFHRSCAMVRMKEITQIYFWWPGLDGSIEEKAKTCSSCQKVRNVPQLALLHPWDWPDEA